MTCVDFHAHIFPERIAKQAIHALAKESGEYRPRTNGTLNGLLESMDRAGIDASVVANIATKPSQLAPILGFSLEVMSPRIYPLVSFHPLNDRADVEGVFGKARAAGIVGVKLHPMYQEFCIDDPKMFPFYEMIQSFGFFLVLHTGFDIAFPGNDQADVERVRRIANKFKGLRVIATHVGGWRQWDRAGILGDCENVYTETSMTLTEMDDELFIRLLSLFSEDRILFGTDSPWTDQEDMLIRTRSLNIPERVKEKMLFENAALLLGL